MRYWKHTRSISEKDGKIFLRDEIHFAPRISFVGFLLLPGFKTIFKNRHKVLQKHFSTLQQ
jgi:ligand-binding SRPBCC domain-containing protein